MTFETATAATQTDASESARKTASLRRAPAQLREGVHTFMSLAKMHPDLHPAVLAAILARPAAERRYLLEAARTSVGSLGSSPNPTRQPKSPSTDSDEVWEDAVEDLSGTIIRPAAGSGRCTSLSSSVSSSSSAASAAMASVVVDTAAEVERLESEAAAHHRSWQLTRQLADWTRYTECRKHIAQLKDSLSRRRPVFDEGEEESLRAQRWTELEIQRQVQERRLAELERRRERLRLSRQYAEQTRVHHAQLAQAELQARLRELDERQQIRRLQHMQRVQQLMQEMADDDLREAQREQRERLRKVKAGAKQVGTTVAAPPAPSSTASTPESNSEFTHIWDDFSHWEKLVSDDREHVAVDECPVVVKGKPPGPVGPGGSMTGQPDLIPLSAPAAVSVTPSPEPIPDASLLQPPPLAAGQAGPWRRSSSTGGSSSRWCDADADMGFSDRKKWFEEALRTWHAQDEAEDFGASLYGGHGHRHATPGPGDTVPLPRCAPAGPGSPWYHAAWTAWQGNAPSAVSASARGFSF